MQRYLLTQTQQPKCQILLRHLQPLLQIIVLPANTNNHFYKSTINNNTIPESLSVFFQTTKQLFHYLKSQKTQNIKFLTNNTDSQIGSSLVPNDRIQFQVAAANRMIKRSLKLNAHKSNQITYNLTIREIEDMRKVQEVKQRIQQKKTEIKLLENKLSLIQVQNEVKLLQIDQKQASISKIHLDKKAKENQIKQIKETYQMNNISLIKGLKTDQQKPDKKKLPQQTIPSASKIFEAMPNPCQLHPLAKHIEFHSGRKTLYLKSKNITDSQIQSMVDYDWEEIEILSLGGNKLTNRSTEILAEISQWKNVSHLYLFSNQITDITKIKFIGNLETLSLYELQLNQASCDYLIKTHFPKLKQIYLNFAQNSIQKCWKKIAASGLQNFPKLQTLSVDNPSKISPQTRVKLNQLCIQKNIKIELGNPSLNQCLIF